MLSRTTIVLHHSLTADGQTVSWKPIERYHRDVNGWNDIGYHAGVEVVNGEILSFLGRDWTLQAAACPQGDMNVLGMHVCLVGNYDLSAPSDAALFVLRDRVVRPWQHMFGIPVERIMGHHDFNPHKTCPGTLFDIERFREMCR